MPHVLEALQKIRKSTITWSRLMFVLYWLIQMYVLFTVPFSVPIFSKLKALSFFKFALLLYLPRNLFCLLYGHLFFALFTKYVKTQRNRGKCKNRAVINYFVNSQRCAHVTFFAFCFMIFSCARTCFPHIF